MSTLLLQNAEVFGDNKTSKQVDIAIEDSKIVYMGELSPEWKADKVINCENMLAIPGFVNTHTHAGMTLFRSYADDMLLMDWLKNKIWPIEAKLTKEDVYWGSLLAIAEMLKSGTTTFADMYFFMEDVAQAVADSGIRGVLSRGLAGVAPNGEQALEESKTFYKTFHNAADGRITVMLGPHAPYTCSPEYLKKVVAAAEGLGAEIHIHLSETQGEVEECIKKYGKTPIALMQEIGLLDCGVLAAHCVHVTASDIEIMQAKNVRVAHNPGSNMKLASGIAPVPQMLKAGLSVGLGTDGTASNNNLDMLEEVRMAALLHKVNTLDPLVIPAHTAVHMGTDLGAQTVGLGDSIGKIAPGFKADITLLNMHSLHWYPRHDRISLLTYAAQASDVHTVIVNGEILLSNRTLTTIDEEKVMYEVNQRAKRLIG